MACRQLPYSIPPFIKHYPSMLTFTRFLINSIAVIEYVATGFTERRIATLPIVIASFEESAREETNVITLHLGNGCSIAAIRAGDSVDTSMGLTPLEGLVMGTRSGDLDPAIVDFVAAKEGLTSQEVETLAEQAVGPAGHLRTDQRHARVAGGGAAKTTIGARGWPSKYFAIVRASISVLFSPQSVVLTR